MKRLKDLSEKAMLYLLYVFICLVIFGVAPGIWVVQSYFEAQAYNRVTGENVSTWDAMWIELRVQAVPRPEAYIKETK